MTIEPWPWSPLWPMTPRYGTCNCACQRCLAGSCCLFATGPLVTATASNVEFVAPKPCGWLGHDYKPWEGATSEVAYCTRCGDTKRLNLYPD